MEYSISLEDLRFYAYHGVYEEEKKNGNKFTVNLTVNLPFNEIMSSDELSSTVSYADLFEIVKEEMGKPRNLMESVAIDILKRIKKDFPMITSGFIKIEKEQPPIPGMMGKASISLKF